MRNNYDVRTFNLQAGGIPLALPPARSYVMLSASVDDRAVSLSVGDGNADLQEWPQGIKISPAKGMPTRISSPFAQTVTVAMVDGEVGIEDSRSVPVPVITGGWSSNVLALASRGTGSTVIVAAATNVRGVQVKRSTLMMQATAANGGSIELRGGALSLADVFAPAGAIATNQQTFEDFLQIQPGVALTWEVTAAVALLSGGHVLFRIM